MKEIKNIVGLILFIGAILILAAEPVPGTEGQCNWTAFYISKGVAMLMAISALAIQGAFRKNTNK